MYQRLLLVLFFFALINNCVAQAFDEKDFTHYTTLSGLSDNYITGITQDEFGYIWISTINGLNRFDGKEIKRIYQTPGREGLISDKLNSVKAIGNKLITYSNKGAGWIDIQKNKFIKLAISEKPSVASFQNTVYDAVVTNNKTCFLTTFTGAYAFDSTGKLIFRYDNYKPDSNGNIIGKAYGLSAVYLDKYKVLHFDNKYDMSIYDSRKNSFLPIDAYKNSLPGLNSLNGTMNIKGQFAKNKLIFLNFYTHEIFIYDKEKDVVDKASWPVWFRKYLKWFSHWLTINDSAAILYGGYKGIYKIKINPSTLQLTYNPVPFFNKYIFTCAFLDRENRLWLGSENGLFRQNIKQSPLHSIGYPSFNDPNIDYKISFNYFLQSNGLLYAGTYNYLPIAVIDGNTYKIKDRISFSTLSPMCNQIWNIIEYSKDTLWFGTQDGLVWYNSYNRNFGRINISGLDTLIQGHSITLLFKDSKGIIWIQSGWGGSGLIRYDPVSKIVRWFMIKDKQNYLPLRVVNFVAEDKTGNIWFAENGLIRWSDKKQIFDTLITNYYGFNKDNIKITSLNSDENGNLIFCNENNGVLMYDPVSNLYKQFSTANGLQENSAYKAISSDNYLWVVTHNYLTAINKKTSKVVSYSYTDSLPATLAGPIYNDKQSHRILVGFDNEIIWTSDTITNNVAKPVSFYIDAIDIAEDTTFLFPVNKIDLNYTQNDITIHYSAINYNDAESNRYAYSVNQKEWIQIGSENSIHFSNLSPGKYEVEIKYYAASNIESETIKKIIFIVHAPFWKQWWFFTIIGLIVGSIIYLYYSKRISEVRNKARIDKQMAEYEIKALHAQMNPHFIFNCLNSIREMILHDENRQASHYLSKFAQLIRITLNNSSKPFISLQNVIEYLNSYLEMEQIRTDNFSSHIKVDDELPTESTFLPPMLIQPFIENAIWHSGPSTNKPIKINIVFINKNNQLTCIVEDNGIGIETSLKNKRERGEMQADHYSVGITNVKQRIQILNEKYNMNSSFTIEDKNNLSEYNESGTLVTIYLPFKNTEL